MLILLTTSVCTSVLIYLHTTSLYGGFTEVRYHQIKGSKATQTILNNMPYVRKNRLTRRPRKGTYRRRPKHTAWSDAAATGRLALRGVNFLKSIINTEFKYFEVAQVPYTDVTNTAYQLVPMALIAQGDDITNRNGRSIKCTSSDLRFKLNLNGTTDSAIVRVLMFIDWAQDGSAPSMSDIYDVVTGDDALQSFRNISTGTSKRYTIMWNKTFSMDKDFKSQIYHTKFKKLTHHIKYVGTGGSAADAGQGMIYLAFIGSGTSPNNCGQISYRHRLRYVDN